ncbi:hypothetical protein ACS0TY_017317 [Phlomoides rotata]
MAPLPRSILFMFLLVLVLALSILGPVVGLFGIWEPINDPNTSIVVKFAHFAVAEHNKEAGTALVLKRVVKAESNAEILQNVLHVDYRLTISAVDGAAAPKTYQAILHDRPEEYVLKLTHFILL